MRYLGGKARTASKIGDLLNKLLAQSANPNYIEPFVGGGWVLAKIKPDYVRRASDISQPLICMYKALQNGWVPPTSVSEEAYNLYRRDWVNRQNDPLTAFIGFGCSFGGKFFGGYARSSNRNYAANCRNGLIKQAKLFQGVQFECCDYRDCEIVSGAVVYCDPPYANVTEYNGCPKFDYTIFWECVRRWSNKAIVLVSEYNAPPDFVPILRILTSLDMQSNIQRADRVECVFIHETRYKVIAEDLA